jgi:hypothetical protein
VRRLYKSFGVKGFISQFFSGRGKPLILNKSIREHICGFEEINKQYFMPNLWA